MLSLVLFLIIECCAPLQRSSNEAALYFLAYMTALPRGAFGSLAVLSLGQLRKRESELLDYATRKSLFCAFASRTLRGTAGNCSTVARWPSHSRLSRTVCPLGNSSAS